MNGMDWRPHAHRLGTCLDTELARQLSAELGVVVTKAAVECARRRRGISSARPPLNYASGDALLLVGAVSDAEAARRLGVTPRAINEARRRHGEPAFCPERAKKFIDWTIVDLSRQTSVLADELGCSKSAVKQARRRLAQDCPCGLHQAGGVAPIT